MPITTSMKLRRYSQDNFAKVAYQVIGYALDLHAQLGRIFHESIYQATLLEMLGNRASDEVEICLSHNGFKKSLYIDLVVDSGCPFELKSAVGLGDVHRSQLIQYLMLTGLTHGKLVNFGREHLEHHFVNCHFTQVARQRFEIDYVDWPQKGAARQLEQIVVPLLRDWGTGLTKSLYHEAVVAFSGGESKCKQFTETLWHGKVTGRQPIYTMDGGSAFEITCIKDGQEAYQMHLQRFLKHTSLPFLLWINVNQNVVRFQRIEAL